MLFDASQALPPLIHVVKQYGWHSNALSIACCAFVRQKLRDFLLALVHASETLAAPLHANMLLEGYYCLNRFFCKCVRVHLRHIFLNSG